jgi:hypothetical protein
MAELRGPMTRHMVLLSALFVGACTVGEVPLPGSGTDGGPKMDSGPTACVNREPSPAPAHTHTAAGLGTAAGQGCVAVGCHGTPAGAGAPPFFSAGTVYKPDKTTPQAGVTVRLMPEAGGNGLTSVTDTAGNFYFPSTAPNPMPALTSATACPTTASMQQHLTTVQDANCNSASCHQQPGGAYGGMKMAD